MTESELWCLSLTDDERSRVGEMLAEALDIPLGDLTPLELFNTINLMLFEFSAQVSTESAKVIPLHPKAKPRQ